MEHPFLFLKGQEVETGASAAARACTICACPVTLSSSSNIQTSVPFKLAGHAPVTYFPDNMLCNIKDEAVCHQLSNLYCHTAPAHTHLSAYGPARQKQRGNEQKQGKNGPRRLFLKGKDTNRSADVDVRRRGNVRDEGLTGQKLNVKSISTVRAAQVWLLCRPR